MLADFPPQEPPAALTPLHALHCRLAAKMVPFAGYAMPLHYPSGILSEHRWTRDRAGLFDVSHMGQVELTGSNLMQAVEAIVPGDLLTLLPGHMRYTQFTNDQGGILDDAMALKLSEERLILVVNAACKQKDIAHMRRHLPGITVEEWNDRAFLALQGPQACEVLCRFVPDAGDLAFMTGGQFTLFDAPCLIVRSGYTGEDGYEISVPASCAESLAESLLAQPDVRPIGLGARDSLRLEAGLCLYGHDIDSDTSLVEAGLLWSVAKRRRSQGGFPGASRMLTEIAEGPRRRRVGLTLQGRLPAREGSSIRLPGGKTIGAVTSGGFSPTLNRPIAMGYVTSPYTAPGTEVELIVRDKPLAAEVTALPFVPRRTHS